MAVLDMILTSIDWDAKFPLAKVTMLPKGVSDHNPLLIDFGGQDEFREHLFRFEKWWLQMEGFADLVKAHTLTL
jgi:hypothetical protein